ncbi:MAG: sigma-70 family RNA polymerase sigma factor [Hyphomicrobiales bacterium]|nr:sigma-70 family RNA polymerase sigma factor [Hyphomicrobiales bacterium]
MGELGEAHIKPAGWRNGDAAAREHVRDRLTLLLKLVASGDQGAMSEVYKATSGRLYALLTQMLPTHGDADEVLQEAYLTVWRRAQTFAPGQGSPMTWLITITRNKAIDRLRSEKHARRTGTLDELTEEPVDDTPSALNLIETGEEHHRLHHCLDQLEDRQRDAIRTAFFSGITYQQLSERASVPLGTMKSWIRRGLISLKACLEA